MASLVRVVLAGVIASGVTLHGQQTLDVLPLSAARVPALVRPVEDGSVVLIYRDALRGYSPAGASEVELRQADGSVVFQRRVGLDVPGASIVTLLDATRSPADQIVVSLVAVGGGATSHLLVYYSTASEAVRIVRISVACMRLTPAPGGGVWCLGPDVDRHNTGNHDFEILHRYSEQGIVQGRIGHQTMFPGSPRPWERDSQVIADGEALVVWMAGRRQLVVLDQQGHVQSSIGVADLPVPDDPRTDYVLASDGRLLVLAMPSEAERLADQPRRALFELSRETGRWSRTRPSLLPLSVRLVASFGGGSHSGTAGRPGS